MRRIEIDSPCTLYGEIYCCLTDGWSLSEIDEWQEFLEKEIKPYYPALYKFIKKLENYWSKEKRKDKNG